MIPLARRKLDLRRNFDPEGKGYDYRTAEAGGMKRDSSGHMGSRDPKTGQMLKGRRHPTWHLAVEGERKAGYEIYKGKDGRYYSRKMEGGEWRKRQSQKRKAR